MRIKNKKNKINIKKKIMRKINIKIFKIKLHQKTFLLFSIILNIIINIPVIIFSIFGLIALFIFLKNKNCKQNYFEFFSIFNIFNNILILIFEIFILVYLFIYFVVTFFFLPLASFYVFFVFFLFCIFFTFQIWAVFIAKLFRKEIVFIRENNNQKNIKEFFVNE